MKLLARLALSIVVTLATTSASALASNIDPHGTGASFAWGENVGWLNFRPANGPGVRVTSTAVTGYAWGENVGWIKLDPTGGGVVNDGAGRLSGFAWGENAGWINFAPTGGGVAIDLATGNFSGSAWGENVGWINFAPTIGGVTTAWRPETTPPVVTPPADVTVLATEAGGARASASPGLATFLAGGSAVDLTDPAPVRLAPMVEGAEVDGDTLFPVGVTTVTFRFDDAAGNVGTATARVTVRAAADLSVTMTATPDLAAVGDTLTYTITVGNNGPNGATAVTVVDTLPAAVAFVSSDVPCSPAASALTCDLGSLDAGATVTFPVVVSVTARTATIANAVSASGAEPDPGPSPNTAETVTRMPVADLAVTLNDLADPALAGQDLLYVMTVTNHGPDVATGIRAELTLPESVTFVPGGTTTQTCTAAGRTVTCAVPDAISSGNAVGLLVRVMTSVPGTLAAAVSATSNQLDPDGASAAVSTTVLDSADLVVTMTGPSNGLAGVSLTYTVTVTNRGPGTATGVVLADILPAGMQLVSTTPSQGSCGTTSPVTCALGTLAPGASATVTVVARPTTGGTLANTASATADLGDPDPANSTATVATSVRDAILVGSPESRCTLIAAINEINNPPPLPSETFCGPRGANTIVLAPGTYRLTDAQLFGGLPFGLPAILRAMTIQGASGDPADTVIERADGAPPFVLFITAYSGPSWATTLTLRHVTLRNGLSTDADGGEGSAVKIGSGTALVVDHCIVEDNRARSGAQGGAITTGGFSGLTSVTNSVFRNNTGPAGAALYVRGPLTVSGSTFIGNRSDTSGGAIVSLGTLTLTDSSFLDNVALQGGAIWVRGAGATIARSVFSGNRAETGDGGAIYRSPQTVSSSLFVSNQAPNGNGGAIALLGSVAITGSTFVDNAAEQGGAISQGGDGSAVATVTDTTISGNRATFVGGGFMVGSGRLNASNVTVTGNVADSDGDGSGVGGGIYVSGVSTVDLRNSIVAGNTGPRPDCSTTYSWTPVTSLGHNVIGNTSGCSYYIAGTGDTVGTAASPVDPFLAPLADNGGPRAGASVGGATPEPIPTQAPLPGSPAIDAGSPDPPGSGGTACAATDQRGEARPVDGDGDGVARCDAGAHEARFTDLVLTASAGPDPVVVGRTLTYTATVANRGSNEVPDVVLTQTLPPAAVLAAATPSVGTCSHAEGVVTCALGALGPGATATVTVVVTPTAEGTLMSVVSVTGRATDVDPASNTASVTVTAHANRRPLASAQSVTTAEDTPVTITLGATDPDGDALSFSIVRPPRRGRLSRAGPTVTYTPKRNAQGRDAFTFVASDGQMTSLPATVVITVVKANDPPFFLPIANRTVLVDSGLHRVPITRISPGPNDERRQTVTITATSSDPGLIPHPTIAGTRPNRALVFRPTPGRTGTAVITVTADDGQPVNNTFTRTFTVTVHAPPTAEPRTLTATEDMPATVTLAGSDPEGRPLTFTVLSGPAHGTLSGTAPDLVYTPAPNFEGTDSFTYQASDGFATSAPATVTITVARGFTLRYSADVDVALGGVTVAPGDVAEDDLAGSVTRLPLGPFPAGTDVDAYHRDDDGAQLLSFDTTVSLPGDVVAGPADVVRFDGASYTVVFRGLSSGVPDGVNVDAVSRAGADLLLSFDGWVTLPGGLVVGPADLVRWDGSTFTRFFDGAGAGVPAGLGVDAAHLMESTGRLLLSFDGSGSVGGTAFNAEDVLEHDPATGAWRLVYTGAARHPGWRGANLDVVWATLSGAEPL